MMQMQRFTVLQRPALSLQVEYRVGDNGLQSRLVEVPFVARFPCQPQARQGLHAVSAELVQPFPAFVSRLACNGRSTPA